MRRIPTHSISEEGQEEAPNEVKDQFNHPNIHQPYGFPQQQYGTPNHFQRLEQYALGMTSWATKISPNFYVEPSQFGSSYQAFCNMHKYHMSF